MLQAYHNRCTNGGEIGYGGGHFRSPPSYQISPLLVQRVAPAARKTSKSASELLKYRRVALRAMLTVKDCGFIKTCKAH